MARLSTFHDGKLKSLGDELKQLKRRPQRAQTSAEKIAALRAIRATMAGGMPERGPTPTKD